MQELLQFFLLIAVALFLVAAIGGHDRIASPEGGEEDEDTAIVLGARAPPRL
ncbi:MAG: hypothetical protein II036_07460 [Oscillospiraceae bacterium]|nr:hypothetical protein [Oscillospiraceae bacterium]